MLPRVTCSGTQHEPENTKSSLRPEKCQQELSGFLHTSQNWSATQLPQTPVADETCQSSRRSKKQGLALTSLENTPEIALVPTFLSLVSHEKIMIKHGVFKVSSKFRPFH